MMKYKSLLLVSALVLAGCSTVSKVDNPEQLEDIKAYLTEKYGEGILEKADIDNAEKGDTDTVLIPLKDSDAKFEIKYTDEGGKDNYESVLIREFGLSDNQKEIIAGEGMPESFDDLSEEQQELLIFASAAMDITEEKYNMELVYSGHESSDVILVNTDNGDSIRISRDNNRITNDYEDQFLQTSITELLKDAAVANLDITSCFVDYSVTDNKLESVHAGITDFEGKVQGRASVYVDSSEITAEADQLTELLEPWFKDHHLLGDLNIYVMIPGIVSQMNEENKTQYFDHYLIEYNDFQYISE